MDDYVSTARQSVHEADARLTNAYVRLADAQQDDPPNAPRIAARERWVLHCEQWLARCLYSRPGGKTSRLRARAVRPRPQRWSGYFTVREKLHP